MIIISIFFFLNVIIIDSLFLQNFEMKFYIFTVEKYSLGFHIEPIGLIFLNMLSVLWIIAIMYTSKFLVINEMENSSRFLLFINACVLCGCLIALSKNLITMFIGYELLSLLTISSYSSSNK